MEPDTEVPPRGGAVGWEDEGMATRATKRSYANAVTGKAVTEAVEYEAVLAALDVLAPPLVELAERIVAALGGTMLGTVTFDLHTFDPHAEED